MFVHPIAHCRKCPCPTPRFFVGKMIAHSHRIRRTCRTWRTPQDLVTQLRVTGLRAITGRQPAHQGRQPLGTPRTTRIARPYFNREQLCVFEMLCTDRRHGRFFWGLGWDARRCSRKFCAATADARKRTFQRGPCNPRAKHMRARVRCNRVFYSVVSMSRMPHLRQRTS